MQLGLILCREKVLHEQAQTDGSIGSRFGPYLDSLPDSYGGLPMRLHSDDVPSLQVSNAHTFYLSMLNREFGIIPFSAYPTYVVVLLLCQLCLFSAQVGC